MKVFNAILAGGTWDGRLPDRGGGPPGGAYR